MKIKRHKGWGQVESKSSISMSRDVALSANLFCTSTAQIILKISTQKRVDHRLKAAKNHHRSTEDSAASHSSQAKSKTDPSQWDVNKKATLTHCFLLLFPVIKCIMCAFLYPYYHLAVYYYTHTNLYNLAKVQLHLVSVSDTQWIH